MQGLSNVHFNRFLLKSIRDVLFISELNSFLEIEFLGPKKRWNYFCIEYSLDVLSERKNLQIKVKTFCNLKPILRSARIFQLDVDSLQLQDTSRTRATAIDYFSSILYRGTLFYSMLD